MFVIPAKAKTQDSDIQGLCANYQSNSGLLSASDGVTKKEELVVQPSGFRLSPE
jgi:hypothetical protein